MAPRLLAALIAACFTMSACQKPPAPAERMPIAGAALSSAGIVSATLCSGGPASFECQWAPKATQLDIDRKRLIKRTEADVIDRDLARQIQASLNTAHELLQTSLDACKVDSHTGNCTGDAATAGEALARASLVLSAIVIPDAIPPAQ